MNDAFESVSTFVEDELGFATSYYNDSYLDRRITARMHRTGRDSYEAYFDVLREDPAEQAALLDALSINVTGFFRNPEVWDGIHRILCHLAEEREYVHVWSAACADGREPYSLSMLVHADSEIDESRVYVRGTDISDEALETARAGRYEESRTTDLAEQLSYLEGYERYVDRDDGTYRIEDPIRDHVAFERHDLISDQPKLGFDLVICRNLFIYIDGAYKEPILETIAGSLRTGGFLVIGKAETIPPRLKDAFEVFDGTLRIYRLREDG